MSDIAIFLMVEKKSGELKDGKIWEGSYVKKNGVVRKRYSEGVAK